MYSKLPKFRFLKMPFYSIKHNVCIFLVCKGAIAIAVALVREERMVPACTAPVRVVLPCYLPVQARHSCVRTGFSVQLLNVSQCLCRGEKGNIQRTYKRLFIYCYGEYVEEMDYFQMKYRCLILRKGNPLNRLTNACIKSNDSIA